MTGHLLRLGQHWMWMGGGRSHPTLPQVLNFPGTAGLHEALLTKPLGGVAVVRPEPQHNLPDKMDKEDFYLQGSHRPLHQSDIRPIGLRISAVLMGLSESWGQSALGKPRCALERPLKSTLASLSITILFLPGKRSTSPAYQPQPRPQGWLGRRKQSRGLSLRWGANSRVRNS